MKITLEVLEANRDALVKERDGYLAESDRLLGQATGCAGALRVLDHLIALAQRPETEETSGQL